MPVQVQYIQLITDKIIKLLMQMTYHVVYRGIHNCLVEKG